MNKRAEQSFSMIQWIGRMLILIMIMFSIIFLMRRFTADTLNVQTVQAEVFANRIFYSSNTFLYYDSDLQKEIPGTFDPKKITDVQFDKSMDYKDTSFIAARFTLYDASKNMVARATHNKESFEHWLPQAQLGLTGKGAFKTSIKSWYVLYVNASEVKKGIVEIEVLLPGN